MPAAGSASSATGSTGASPRSSPTSTGQLDDLISITEADIEAIGTEADSEVEVDTGAADPDDTWRPLVRPSRHRGAPAAAG